MGGRLHDGVGQNASGGDDVVAATATAGAQRIGAHKSCASLDLLFVSYREAAFWTLVHYRYSRHNEVALRPAVAAIESTS